MDTELRRKPGLFVLQAEVNGDTQTVAHGVSFPEPSHRVVINWGTAESLEVLDSVDSLYEKFGDEPAIRWYDDDALTDTPTETLEAH